MIELRSADQVRSAEERAFLTVPPGSLMQQAAMALSVSCARLLHDVRGGVVGARVVLLVGSGNNGGDALWAGSMLARRGCRVEALCLSDRFHQDGARALLSAGGLLQVRDGRTDVDALLQSADLIVDGILGIGGSGALRPDAAGLVTAASESGAVVVAVDLPSGVDADTGLVDGLAIEADLTVTFGAVKPGLLVAPGLFHSGTIRVIDIGLDFGQAAPVARSLDALDVASWVPEPSGGQYKYSRGVVGLAVGSAEYRGAGLLATAAARHANVGMVRLWDRGDGVADLVVAQYPDVVMDAAAPALQEPATAWACGSGFPGTEDDEAAVLAVLDAEVPVVLDAGALTVVGRSAAVRSRIVERGRKGLTTVLTPHDGEFERLCPGLLRSGVGRLAAAQQAADELACIVVLKGPGTIIAAPSAVPYIDTEGTADLGTAGSGDVLTGILGALLAGARAEEPGFDAVQVVAAGVWLHGRAGRLAARKSPVTAPDIASCVAASVHSARFGEAS